MHSTRAKNVKDIKHIWPRPHVSKPARADAFYGSLKKASVFFLGISLPSTDITRIRKKTLTKTQRFEKRSPETKGRFPRSLFWCGRLKRKTIETNLEQNKNVSLPLSFFNECRISKVPRCLPCNDTSAFTDISTVFNFSFTRLYDNLFICEFHMQHSLGHFFLFASTQKHSSFSSLFDRRRTLSSLGT